MEEDVATQYASQLKELKMNSKPMINVLTMIAEDVMATSAPIVVQTIERHLASVHQSLKLPVLYLIDSIVKNVNKDYPSLFTQNIVSSFCGVFEKADEKVKQQMFKLRKTWDVVFPQRKLYAIDVRCHNYDEKWPILCSPPSTNASSIHVNPKFLTVKDVKSELPAAPTAATPASHSPVAITHVATPLPLMLPTLPELTEIGPLPQDEAKMRAKLLQKQKELLELQQKKIELELMQMQTEAAAVFESKRLDEADSSSKQEKMVSKVQEKEKKSSSKDKEKKETKNREKAEDSRMEVKIERIIRKDSRSPIPDKKEGKRREHKDKSSRRSTSKDSPDRETFDVRKTAVLKQNYKKNPEIKVEENKASRQISQVKPQFDNDIQRKIELELIQMHSDSAATSESKRFDEMEFAGKHAKTRIVQEKEKKSSPKDTKDKKESKKREKTDDSRMEVKIERINRKGSRSPIPDKKEGKRREHKDKSSRRSTSKDSPDRETFDVRRTAVLKRNYRKNPGIKVEEEENKAPRHIGPIKPLFDIDIKRDDLEPPTKQNRTEGNNIVDLFGREDVDLRPQAMQPSGPRGGRGAGRHDLPLLPATTVDRNPFEMPVIPDLNPFEMFNVSVPMVPSDSREDNRGRRGGFDRGIVRPHAPPDINPFEMFQDSIAHANGGRRVGAPFNPYERPINNVGGNPFEMFNGPRLPAPGPVKERRGRRSGKPYRAGFDRRPSGRPDFPMPQNQTQKNQTPDISNILALAQEMGLLPPTAQTENPKSVPMEIEKAKEVEIEVPMQQQQQPVVQPLPTVDVHLGSEKKNYFKERRQILINQLLTGTQCASCGLRFPPDQGIRYSQHLDWHFRRNRREKSNTKRAQSRSWYYNLADWIQFEEVEDVDERPGSMFEKDEFDDGDSKSPSSVFNSEDYTVVASGHEGAICPQCGETWRNQSYYDENREEWRLKDAILDEADGETKLYHVICHQDYLNSLVDEAMQTENDDSSVMLEVASEERANGQEAQLEPEPEAKEDTGTTSQTEVAPLVSVPATSAAHTAPVEEDDEVQIVKEGKKEVLVMEIDVDDEDRLESKKDEKTEFEKNKEVEKGPDLTIDKNTENTDKPVPNYSVIVRAVSSPIVVNDDSSSNLLPGISEDSTSGVFGFALDNERRARSESPEAIEEKKIVYKSMEFDIPRIKIEPLDEADEGIDVTDAELSGTVAPTIEDGDAAGAGQDPQVGTEPITIDIFGDEDSVDSAPPPLRQMTSIDGNLRQEETIHIPYIPTNKIRINISGLDITSSSKDKDEEPKASTDPTKSPKDATKVTEATTKTPTCTFDEPTAEIVFSEETKRLKPHLVGRKLVNYPPKPGIKDKDVSGLCVIC